MNPRILHRLIATLIFIISVVQFMMTAQPSVSFWDPGELSAAACALEVPHPPGGPLFSLVGRIFYMLPVPGDIGFRMNLVSVFASAFSVLFLYLVAVRLIRITKGREPTGGLDALGTYLSAAIGALALSFCDTFWFNGGESNYFAASTLLFSAVVWLMLVWYEKSAEPGSWKYFLMIAFLIGLSAGVHLMSVLSIFTVVMLIVIKRYVQDDQYYKRSSYIFLGHAAVLLLIALMMWGNQTSQEAPTYEQYKTYDTNFKLIMGSVSIVVMAIFWKKVFHKNSFYLPVLAGGVALGIVYPGIIKLLPTLLVLIAGDNSTAGFIVLILILSLVGYLAFWAVKRKKPIVAVAALAFILAVVGVTTYTMIIIRANQHPPMNENNPNSFSRLITYLDREQYGDFPIFKRRWSNEPRHQATWAKYSSDVDFFWRYQMDHMFNRYVFWNFIGRASYDQDAGVNWKHLFGIPFIVGLFGLYFHFRKDWKMASAFLLLFILMGYLTAFYQNQQEAQPRDRDYFYGGAYFVFALWIALGVRGLLDQIEQKRLTGVKAPAAIIGALVLFVLLIPGRMFQMNYFPHDRSKNWLPWDYAYNLLQSCTTNSILFTNGDNDTFPLWFLQDVEGVRRDIRIVNLSLVNTDWYIKQLKHEKPYGTPQVKMSLSDDDIERIARLSVMQWTTQQITLPVPPEVMAANGVTDTAVLNRKSITFSMAPTLHYGNVGAVRTQDVIVKDIIQQNAWQRPVYFASTCGEDTKIGVGEYLKLEGLAGRLVPQKRGANQISDYVDEALMRKNLFEETQGFSKTYQSGFKFRGLNDRGVFYDENQAGTVQNSRGAFMALAMYYLQNPADRSMGLKTLERMDQVMPREVVPMDYRQEFNLGLIYSAAGDTTHFSAIAESVIKSALAHIEENPNDVGGYYNPYRLLIEMYDRTGQYGKAAEVLDRLQSMFPNDPGIKRELDRYKEAAERQTKGQPPQ
jgi:hypothetical protein